MKDQCQEFSAHSREVWLPHVARGQDVQQRDLAHAVWMVERQAMRGARAPVVTGQEEAIVAERGHHVDLILSHGAERVVDVFRAAIGGAHTVAIAAEVGRDNVESPGQRAGDLVPGGMR